MKQLQDHSSRCAKHASLGPPQNFCRGAVRQLPYRRGRPPITVTVLDDHPMITAGLAFLISRERDMQLLHAHHSSSELLTSLAVQPCDVIVLDFYLPNQPWDGVDIIRRVRRNHPAAVIITYSGGRRVDTEYAAYRSGANAHLPKWHSMDELIELIRTAVNAPGTFLRNVNGNIVAQTPTHPVDKLTCAENEVLRNIMQGYTVTQIAQRLLRSKKTISTHKRSAMAKLGVSDDVGLARCLGDKFGYGSND
jgi:two-component system capsular synthesis response regulator RcsB